MDNKDGVASTSQGDEDTMAFGITDVVQNRNYDTNDLLQQIWNSDISEEPKSANNSYPEDYGRCEITVDHFMKHIRQNEDIIIEKLDIGTKTKLKNIIFGLYNVDFPNLTGKQRLLVEMILSLLQCTTPGKQLTNMTNILTSNDNSVVKTKDLHTNVTALCNNNAKMVKAFETIIFPFMSLTKILKKFADPENVIISEVSGPEGRDEGIVAVKIGFKKPLVVEAYEECKKSAKYIRVTKVDSQAIFDAIKKALNLPKIKFGDQHSIEYPDDSYIWKPLHRSKSPTVKMAELDKAGRYLAVIESVEITSSAGPWTARSSVLTLQWRDKFIHFIDFNHGKRKIERLVDF